MPSKNSVKEFDAPAFYHIYNRGAGKQPIFADSADKQKFIDLIDRYLDPANEDTRSDGLPYPKYEIEIIAYCLMGNHFHLLVYQEDDPEAITGLMRSVLTAYTMYFNVRHKRSGHLFQGVYKASRIVSEPYLLHISRYIHLNPRTYQTYKWSSIGAYLGKSRSQKPWLHPDRVSDMIPSQYLTFLEGYEDIKASLDSLKKELGI